LLRVLPLSLSRTLSLCGSIANFRARYNITGNMIADFTYATLFWPQVLNQMLEELESGIEKVEADL